MKPLKTYDNFRKITTYSLLPSTSMLLNRQESPTNQSADEAISTDRRIKAVSSQMDLPIVRKAPV